MASHARRLWPRSTPVRRRSHPLLKVALACLAAGAVLLNGAPANAEPTVAELEKQIDEAWTRLEPVIEQHNATRQKLAASKAKAATLAKQIQPLALQVDLAMARVSEIAVRAYKGGHASALNALLGSGSPTALADQLSLLEQMARAEQEQISSVVDLKSRYEDQKEPLDNLVAQLATTEAVLATKAKEIDAEIKRLQALRLRAYGTTVSTGSLRPAPCPSSYPGGAAGTAINFACAQIGKPYQWGADGPDSYDCSGLTMAAWGRAGVYLPHNAASQRREVPYVSRANLRPGDLVFYYSDLHHVAMYAGNGWIVHASQPGVPVRMRTIDSAPIHSYGRPG